MKGIAIAVVQMAALWGFVLFAVNPQLWRWIAKFPVEQQGNFAMFEMFCLVGITGWWIARGVVQARRG